MGIRNPESSKLEKERQHCRNKATQVPLKTKHPPHTTVIKFSWSPLDG